MATSIFDDKLRTPDDPMLQAALAQSYALWRGLYAYTDETYTASAEWKFYSKKAGWSYVVKSGKRTLYYLIPRDGYFKINYVFGEKAVNAARDAGMAAEIIRAIEDATPYAEGRPFMIDVRTDEDIAAAKRLIEIKANH